MLRKMFPVAVLILFFAVIGVGQSDPKVQLQQQLLTQEEMQALLGTQWIIDSLAELDNVPDGVVANVVGTYKDTNTSEIVVLSLISFKNVDATTVYLDGLKADKHVSKVRDLLQEAKDAPKDATPLLTDQIKNEAQEVIFVELTNGLQQLMLRRANMLTFFRSSMTGPVDLTKLVSVADKQLGKTLDFCKKAAENGGTAPDYCAK
ncbi:hypothetical protein HY229_00130 [Candidatus Acetothermia bacterium]|nr:hypothetical protein [Candidatus Acetothermia bacterium]MBI3642503.1 hypothetical protein [Candidatus Acetothermia bacterium]